MFMLRRETFELRQRGKKGENKTTEPISPSCRGEQAEERIPKCLLTTTEIKRQGVERQITKSREWTPTVMECDMYSRCVSSAHGLEPADRDQINA